jgi:hypothetical protein
MLSIIEQDSVYGERHNFKLRYLSISNCSNLYPFEFKIKSKLDQFYLKNRKIFISYKSDEKYIKLDKDKKVE